MSARATPNLETARRSSANALAARLSPFAALRLCAKSSDSESSCRTGEEEREDRAWGVQRRQGARHHGAGEWSVSYRLHAEPGLVWDPSHVFVIVDTRRGVACFLGETIEPDD